jgi:hypothetical protein
LWVNEGELASTATIRHCCGIFEITPTIACAFFHSVSKAPVIPGRHAR